MSSPHHSPEQRAVELGLLLQRLELSLLHADEDREKSLRRNEFERARLQQNLAYGFSIFASLQNADSSSFAASQRQNFQNDLSHKADLLDLLQDRLRYLNDLAAHDDGGDSAEENSDWTDDDVFGGLVPTPSESTDSQLVVEAPVAAPPTPKTQDHEPIAPQPKPATVTAQSLRPRNKRTPNTATTQSATPKPTETTSVSAHTTARATLFASRKAHLSAPQTSNATAEAILDHQRSEQNALSESILQMAAALKTSSQRFSDTLDQDKDSLNRATDGITKTEESMEAAGRRMNMLRRMTEGKGWWGRMMLFAWVYGLMVALILLVFVLPKLRF
ncbi:hypothetical protein TD95_001697 [Thielaviopsis punctulata]|uniref:t-SNARE coiled-coil homology domain-containing protein n=1 Tax=Thielaviopsis punctulata TaxID=72032 RepID=A0A0F4Z8A6_9PEZI|nr:hypothetical protein TD95_001697 [Thielaviopsis punctulata]